MLDKATLIQDLQALFEAGSNDSAIMAIGFAEAIDKFVKTGSIKTGTLSSVGTGNLGVPVNSNNITNGVIE